MRTVTYELPYANRKTLPSPQGRGSIEFNTGRQYTDEGQPIRCTVHRSDSGRPLGIVFADRARCISGYIPYFGDTDPFNVVAMCLISYDLQNYSHDHTGIAAELWQDVTTNNGKTYCGIRSDEDYAESNEDWE